MANVISLTGGSAPSFSIINVHEKQVLNYASLGENSNKFYIAQVEEGSGTFPFRIYTEYGRMGKTPKKEGRFYTSLWSAKNDYDDLIRQKEGKGYKKVDVDDGFSYSPSIINITTKAPKVDLSTIGDKVLKFIGKLYQVATGYIVKSIDTPLGKLSASQVAKGLQVLSDIEEMLDNGRTSGLEYSSNDFYSIIPVTFGSKVDYRKFLIDDYNKLNEKKDLLGVMSSVVKVQDSLEKTLEEKYKALKIKLKALSSRTKEYKRLVNFVQTSKGHNHHFGFDIKEIYEIEDMTGFDKFNPYKVSTKELFHGSRNENILSIMQNGLKIKPKSAIHSGSMFGTGIYFADSSTKSGNYTSGFGNSKNGDSYFLFVCDVATGKIKEYDSAQPHLSSAPSPYNSVMGKKGSSLVHDEFIVYRDNQVKLKYIIEFKFTR